MPKCEVAAASVVSLKVDTQVVDDPGKLSDGFHTFDELYEHRHTLFMVLYNQNLDIAWKSKLHPDGTMFEGDWFIAGLNLPNGAITYHIPMRLWDSFDGQELERAPEWDGHTAEDVLKRLRGWWWAKP